MINVRLEGLDETKKREYFDGLHEKVMIGIKSFNNEKDFSEACHFLIKLCLSVNDYIHSNNIMQCYKSYVVRNRPSWYYYYSILIYGKRYPKYFLNKPGKLSQCTMRYLKTESPDALNVALINLLLFYIKLYKNYQDVFKTELQNFVQYFKAAPLEHFNAFNQGVQELKEYLEGTISYEDIGFDLNRNPVTFTQTSEEVKQVVCEPKDDFIVYAKDPKVLIIGDLSVSKDKVMGIAKNIGFEKHQIEVLEDFSAIKTYDINKLRHNEHYCGIIFGPLPHSAKGAQGDSSIITHVENGEGYPYHVRAEANQALKLTKTSVERSLTDVYNHYLATR